MAATLWAVAGAAGPDLSGTAGTYRVDAKESFLAVKLKPEGGLFSGLSHRHVIRATEASGRVVWDPSDPKSCEIQITIPVSGLRADAPEDRDRAGLEGDLDADDRRTVEEHMRAEGQLYAEKYPKITFEARDCKVRDDGILVDGTFRVRGDDRRAGILMQVDFEQGRLHAQGSITLQHSDFGFEPYEAALGAVANDESLEFVLDIVAERAEG